jgi:hypothetical protein
MENFIADKNVISVIGPLEEKTPAGNDMVKVCFGDGTEEVMPKKRFELTVTEGQSDATKVQVTLATNVASILYATLLEYGVKTGEVDKIVNLTLDLVQDGHTKARTIKMGYDDMALPLIEINKILFNDATTKNNSGTTSAGVGTDTGDQK